MTKRPEILDDALKNTTGWKNLESATNTPKLTINFFITKKVRKDQVTASKPFERGHRIYGAKKVRSISIYQAISDTLFNIIKAAVLPSQKTDRIYQTIIIVAYKASGDIHAYYANCTCAAGEGGS